MIGGGGVREIDEKFRAILWDLMIQGLKGPNPKKSVETHLKPNPHLLHLKFHLILLFPVSHIPLTSICNLFVILVKPIGT
jgi:hypothetical protein